MKVLILGAGAYGTALAERLSWGGENEVVLYSVEQDVVQDINRNHANEKYFPGRRISDSIVAIDKLADIAGSKVVFLAIPSSVVEPISEKANQYLETNSLVINLAKGLAKNGEVLWRKVAGSRVASMKGPTFAIEMFNGLPSALTFSSKNQSDFPLVEDLFSGSRISLDFSNDIDGVEYVSVLKNVYAIALGIVAGRYNSPNVDFMLLTKAANEMKRYLAFMNCDEQTVFKYCGIGDLGLTGLNDLSRNRTLGLLIGKGFLNDSQESSVVMEGLRSVQILAQQISASEVGESGFSLMLSLNRLLMNQLTVAEFCDVALS